jgi:amino acid adenylation domain-containing protein
VSIRTIAEDLSFRAAEAPGKAAVIAGDRELSYGELDRLAAGFASGLRELGVRRGDRVVIVLPNGVEAPIAFEGTLRAGAALSPLSPTIKRDRLRYVLDDVEPAALVCDSERAEMAAAAEALAGPTVPVVADVAELAASEGTSHPLPLETDLAAVMYTSGSTGEPKGVTLTHRNLSFVTGSIAEYLEMSQADRVLCVLQLSFGYGLCQLLTCMQVGATLVLEEGFSFPGRVVQLLEEHRITGLPAVPTIFQVLVSLRGLADRELPDLRFLTNAGASLPEATVAAVRRTFPGAQLYLMYGLTECIRVSYLPPDRLDAPTSSGIPIPGTDAWVAAPGGREAAIGEVGELMVRGPHVMHGYWRDPERTAERLRRGRWPWESTLATGDLFRRDDEGLLHWVGRTDDLIKCRGEKVYPREVEEVLHAVDGVREAAVVGVPDRLLGQAVHAHVAPEHGVQLDPAALRRECAERLEAHKVPGKISLHDELPRTARGKVDRRMLIVSDEERPASESRPLAQSPRSARVKSGSWPNSRRTRRRIRA